jgi:hypothetical protein
MNSFDLYRINNRQDIFGFYEVGKLKFYSQIEALEVSRKFNLPITWNFNDEIFSSYDWQIEPEETISELYVKRCEQLREKYDYLVLFYSGGADSDNILNYFIKNNIHLDEVVCLTNYEGSQDRLSRWNAEIYEVAMPKIKKIQEKNIHLRLTEIDMTQMILKKYSQLNVDQIYKQNVTFAPFTSIKDEIKTSQKHWQEMFSSGKKVGFIHGIDKPRIDLRENGNFIFFFSCVSVNGAIPPSIQEKNNSWEFDEFFYWSPDAPKIPIKQSHIVKNFVKTRGIEIFNTYAKSHNGGKVMNFTPHGAFTLTRGSNYLFNGELNNLIYPYWYDIPYQIRGVNMILFEKENWFIEKMNSEKCSENWKILTKKVLELTKTDYKEQNFLNGALYLSRPYNLGK